MNMTALLRSATNVINGAKFRLRLSLIEGAGQGTLLYPLRCALA
jgi:hypothetical protein